MNTANELESVRAAVSVTIAEGWPDQPTAMMTRTPPVVTISRKAGANAAGIATRLVELLNIRDSGGQEWLRYERRLVERVAEDHDLAKELVTRFGERDRSWFRQFTAGLRGDSTEREIAGKMAQTIRALAAVGRAVIVGRGSQCLLADVPSAIHIRLTAPAAWRAEHYSMSAGEDVGRGVVAALERSDTERAKFIRNHFNCDIDDPNLYHLTVNIAAVSADRAARMIAELVPTFP